MKLEFVDSNKVKYTFEIVDRIPQLEVGYPSPLKEKILQVFIEQEGYVAGLANISLRDDLKGIGFLHEEVQRHIIKIWKNRAFL